MKTLRLLFAVHRIHKALAALAKAVENECGALYDQHNRQPEAVRVDAPVGRGKD